MDTIIKRPKHKAKFSKNQLLYSLLAIERFGDRMWSILLGFLVNEWCQKLNLASNRYLAIFYLVPSTMLTIIIPKVGKLLSKYNRVKSLRLLTILQNLGVVVSAGTFLIGINFLDYRALKNV